MREIKIYFGRYDKEGEFIDNNEFFHFLFNVFNPKFPGYTIVPCKGVWNSQMEPSTIIELVTEDTPETTKNLSDICQTYINLFNQESVLNNI